jgi:hypothetical protein
MRAAVRLGPLVAMLLMAVVPPAAGAATRTKCYGVGLVGAWGSAPSLAGSSYANQTVRVVLIRLGAGGGCGYGCPTASGAARSRSTA